MALGIKVEKHSSGIMLVILILIAIGIYMALVAVHALITGSDYIIQGIIILEYLDFLAAALLSLVCAAIFFTLAYGIWKLAGWARAIMMAISGIGVVFFPLKGLVLISNIADPDYHILSSDIVGGILTAVGLVISVVFLLILSRPDIIMAFEANEVIRIKNRIGFLNEKMELGRKRCNEGEISKAELSKLRSECLAEERLLKGRIRHFEKIRLSRERKLKDKLKKKEEKREERLAYKERREAEKGEKEAEAEAEEEEAKEKGKSEDEGAKPEGKANKIKKKVKTEREDEKRKDGQEKGHKKKTQ